jgi:putative ATP-binding cassette transporter
MKIQEKVLDKVGLYGLLVNCAPNKTFLSLSISILAGLVEVMFLPVLLETIQIADVSNAMQYESFPVFNVFGYDIAIPKFAGLLFAMVLFGAIARGISGRLMNEIVTQMVYELKGYIYKKVSASSIRNLEEVGSSNIMAVLTTDLDRIAFGTRMLPVMINYGIVLVGLFGVLYYLEASLFAFILVVTLFVIACYRVFAYFGEEALIRVRKIIDTILEGNKGIIYGAKELKLNAEKSSDFNNQLVDLEDVKRKKQLTGNTLFMLGDQYGQMIYKLAIACIACVSFNFYNVSIETVLAVVMVMIYMGEPIAGVLQSMEQVIPARISLQAMRRCVGDLQVEELGQIKPAESVKQLHIDKLSYEYQTADSDQVFEINDINLTLKAGEVTFIAGGNGSGKSTLAKLLTLHYVPKEGDINFDGVLVNNENRHHFRQHVAAIFTDYYLFTDLYGMDTKQANLAKKYLHEFRLSEKVKLENNRFSTTKLSDGQRKRLALIVSFLEDRDIYLFDEWAADQDPVFKEVFYKEIIHKLKAQGKIVIVISHDDRYFNEADQLVKMEFGRIVSVKSKSDLVASGEDLKQPKLDKFAESKIEAKSGSKSESKSKNKVVEITL